MIATVRFGSLSNHFQKLSISHCAEVFMQLRSFSRDIVARITRSAGYDSLRNVVGGGGMRN